MRGALTILLLVVSATCSPERSGSAVGGVGEGEGVRPGEGEGPAEGEGEGPSPGEGEGEVPVEGEGGDACDGEPGQVVLGEPCDTDCDCADELCTYGGSGFCTSECEATLGCPFGLVCDGVAGGRFGCVPAPAMPEICEGHGDCPFPLSCIRDADSGLRLCDWPECRFPADCDTEAEERCDRASRRCVAARCATDVDCPVRGEVCDTALGRCGGRECEETADCEDGRACVHPGHCREAVVCAGEEDCPFYNEHCVDAFCVPDPCASASCGERGLSCDPDTGRCGRACEQGCGDRERCGPAGVACVPDALPIAVARAVETGAPGAWRLDGEGSWDPEGGALTYRWTVQEAPGGSALVSGQALSAEPRHEVRLDVPGLYRVGLHVTDEARDTGIPDGVMLSR